VIPDPTTIAASIQDALQSQNPLLDALDAAQRRAQEATANVKAIQAALSGLEDDAQIEALESDAKNAEGRKAAATLWLKKCTAYQGYKEQLADAQRIQRDAQAHADDCERRLRSAEKTLAALVALAEMVCHAEARAAAQVHLEEKRLYLKGALEYRAAAEALLAARQGAARGLLNRRPPGVCKMCGQVIERAGKGPPRQFCSDRCRKESSRQRAQG